MYDVIILGGGAAGMMCAIEAGKRGRKVLLIERNNTIGEKIRISGGGRCNFTNLLVDPEHFLSSNPHFCRSALARFTPGDFIRMVERHGIPYHEKKLGQLFCNGSSREIIALLLKESAQSGVEIITGCHVNRVEKPDGFCVESAMGEFRSRSLVVATGGLSIPKLGATDFGHRIAARFGLTIVPPRPGLVPLTFDGTELEFCRGLSGISLEAEVSCGSQTFHENVLFTHRGLSGPAILQISSYWNPGLPISINLSPSADLGEYLRARQSSDAGIASVLSELFPRRFVATWCERNLLSGPMTRHSLKNLSAVAERFNKWTLTPQGTEGYEKAEVTCGGVSPDELSSRTMESKKVSGLFFIGEVLDVTGHLGGYNFQWAWASGFSAGQFV